MGNKLAKMFATFFYCGDFPLAPGTFTTAVGMLLCIGLSGNPVLYVLVCIAILVLGVPASAMVEKQLNKKDPCCVVIDEVAGIMVSFFLLPVSWPVIFTTFFLFRAFDMFKIYPVNKIEKLGGGIGIMFDDVMAGVYTNVIMHIAIRVVGII